MCICVCAVCKCLHSPEECAGSLQLQFQAGSSYLAWVLRTELGFSGEQQGFFKHRASLQTQPRVFQDVNY